MLQRLLNSLRAQSQKTSGRRGFLKGMLAVLVLAPAIAALEACNQEGGGGGEAPPAGMTPVNPETDATAKALGYHADATKVDATQWPKRAGAEGAKQFCKACNFYTAANGTWGKCTLIPTGVVNSGGWCNSWSPKAGA